MAKKKIHELSAETELTDTHLFITQNGKSDTKTASFALIKTFLSGTGGNKWLVSETEPTENINVDDLWLSSASETKGNVYQYDGSEWIYTTNINGVTEIVSSAIVHTNTLTNDGWSMTSIPYTYEIDISGMTEDLSPVIDLVVSDDIETGVTEINEWLKVTKAVSGDGKITFLCYQQVPTVDLNIKIKVV